MFGWTYDNDNDNDEDDDEMVITLHYGSFSTFFPFFFFDWSLNSTPKNKYKQDQVKM